MVSKIEVLQKIYSYLRNELDISSFRDWMVQAQLELECAGDEAAKRILWELEAYYAEFSDNLCSEQLWRKTIERLAQSERAGTEPMVVGSILVTSPVKSYGGNPASNSAPVVQEQVVECIAS